MPVLFVDTPLKVTVILLIQDGKDVNEMLVPDVLATAVPEVMPSIAPELIVTLVDPSIVTDMIYPSYKMFTEPASKVSVPLPVVMRTRSSVPDKVFEPPPIELIPKVLLDNTDENDHSPVELFNKTNVATPSKV